ncbi:uncharacterized protein LOC119594313 [Penaeus monodon]|uniref:uncharacterized protein LOC119594313 n=1 Tax=Penaeus monodon TaxID=6687 RepID=UPI0018A76C07|nr:uncharacterized protein LOC119594313 [Penaeus monodon]
MNVKLCLEEMINVVCAYAPQVGCDEEEKVAFWEHVDLKLSAAPAGEKLILGGDLNGHIRGEIEVVERNEEVERLLGVAMAFDMAICNTFFKKMERGYMICKSGDRERPIEFFLCRRVVGARDKASTDFTYMRQAKDQQRTVLNEEDKIKERWSGYF